MWCQVEREREAKGHWDTKPESEEAILEVDPLVLPAPANTTVDQRHTSQPKLFKIFMHKIVCKDYSSGMACFVATDNKNTIQLSCLEKQTK